MCIFLSPYIISHALNFHMASCKCCSSMITLGHEELESKVQAEQAQIEASTNLVLV
jgi:hypothetical protein